MGGYDLGSVYVQGGFCPALSEKGVLDLGGLCPGGYVLPSSQCPTSATYSSSRCRSQL